MKLTLGFSPCPNDTFIFDALVNGKIDTEGLQFEFVMADVEELNRKAFAKAIDITKLSYHAFAYAANDYVLLNSGSALGNNCGPLLIAKTALDEGEISKKKIAIPGEYTTANFLFSLAYPGAENKSEILFSEIEQEILDGKVDAGVIIHENRFTYQQKGLVKIRDLGEHWEMKTSMPIPLGGIAISRKFPLELQEQVDRLLKQSVLHALENPASPMDFVKTHAQEMDESVMKEHIALYVNDFTVDLGSKGKEAVKLLLSEGLRKGILPAVNEQLFVE